MFDCRKYVDYIVEQAKSPLTIDSPSGYGREVTEYLLKGLGALRMPARRTVRGRVTADFGGRNKENGILLGAHCDILGGMVARIKESGRLKLTNTGDMKSTNAEVENIWIITKTGGIYEGTCQLVDISVHVNDSHEKTERTWDTVEVLVDENTKYREDAVRLGIMPGDYACSEPRTRITSSGYIKNRFSDDKLSVAILLRHAKYIKGKSVNPERRVYAHFTIYGEVRYGGAASVPEGVTEAQSVDMGCVGGGLQCTEREASICAKNSGDPHNCDIVYRLIELAKEHGIGYAMDVYPRYDSDVETTLEAGHDVCHALVGPGVYTSHGYERSHRDGAENTFRLIQAYIR